MTSFFISFPPSLALRPEGRYAELLTHAKMQLAHADVPLRERSDELGSRAALNASLAVERTRTRPDAGDLVVEIALDADGDPVGVTAGYWTVRGESPAALSEGEKARRRESLDSTGRWAPLCDAGAEKAAEELDVERIKAEFDAAYRSLGGAGTLLIADPGAKIEPWLNSVVSASPAPAAPPRDRPAPTPPASPDDDAPALTDEQRKMLPLELKLAELELELAEIGAAFAAEKAKYQTRKANNRLEAERIKARLHRISLTGKE